MEGPEAWERFETAMRAVLAVPHAVIQKRVQAECQRSAQNPKVRGPKRKSR